MQQQALVSVVMITYGHEKFIRQSIEGVLMQKCNFEVELIIANDCSPDNSNEIISEIIKTDSRANIINYFKHEKNIGMMSNFIFALQKAKGKYLALCEGDDYWTDSFKLQKQFNILEQYPNCDICFTDNSKLFPNSKLVLPLKKNINTITDFKDLVRDNYIATITVFFRNFDKNIIPKWYEEMKIGDWPLYLLLLSNGKNAYYLEENTAVYRYGVGVSTGLRKKSNILLEIKNLILTNLLEEATCKPFSDEIKIAIINVKYNLLTSYVRESNPKKLIQTFLYLCINDSLFKTFKLLLFSIYKKIKS